MFTPPSSPSVPRPSNPTQPPSTLYSTEKVSSRISTSSSNVVQVAQFPTLADLKKRTGRRILLFVFLLPATLILAASLRHIVRIHVIDDRPTIFAKREPQVPSSVPSPTISAPAIQSSPITPTATNTSSSSLPTVPATPPPLPTPLPQPFDLTLSSNFSTRSCEAFFALFTQQEDFRQCRSFAFLLNSSSAFLDAQHNLSLFNAILWATCNTPRSAADCDATMLSYLSRLNSDCHIDLDDGNQAALQAQIGFQSYTAMRTAGCLTDPTTNTYCYLDAVAATNPADVYFYAIPLGTPVPPDTKPSCSSCIKNLLALYAQYVGAPRGSSLPLSGSSTTATVPAPSQTLSALSKTYPAAARLAVNQCGGTYASVAATENGGVPSIRQPTAPWSAMLFAVALCVAI